MKYKFFILGWCLRLGGSFFPPSFRSRVIRRWREVLCNILKSRGEKPKIPIQPQATKTKSTQHTMLIARYDFCMEKILCGENRNGNCFKVMTTGSVTMFNEQRESPFIQQKQQNSISRQTERRKSII